MLRHEPKALNFREERQPRLCKCWKQHQRNHLDRPSISINRILANGLDRKAAQHAHKLNRPPGLTRLDNDEETKPAGIQEHRLKP